MVNLIPAFPLDGGKLVHLVVEERWGPRNATLIVGGLGLVFACVSTLVLIGSAISGFPIWAPPDSTSTGALSRPLVMDGAVGTCMRSRDDWVPGRARMQPRAKL